MSNYSFPSFITIEGGEGSGKSTQISLIEKYLNSKDIQTLTTREPGGCFGAEKIREIVVNSTDESFCVQSELLLMIAARAEHVNKVIVPAIESGKVVICDRYIDSTIVYQGIVQGIDVKIINEIHKMLKIPMPCKTLLFDIPEEIGLCRAGKRGDGEDRFEKKGNNFHKNVRRGYLSLVDKSEGRISVLDATKPIDEIEVSIKFLLNKWFFEK